MRHKLIMDNDLFTYTLNEVAKIFKVSRRSIYQYIADGRLQAIKFGRVWRITADAVKDIYQNGLKSNKYKARRSSEWESNRRKAIHKNRLIDGY